MYYECKLVPERAIHWFEFRPNSISLWMFYAILPFESFNEGRLRVCAHDVLLEKAFDKTATVTIGATAARNDRADQVITHDIVSCHLKKLKRSNKWLTCQSEFQIAQKKTFQLLSPFIFFFRLERIGITRSPLFKDKTKQNTPNNK